MLKSDYGWEVVSKVRYACHSKGPPAGTTALMTTAATGEVEFEMEEVITTTTTAKPKPKTRTRARPKGRRRRPKNLKPKPATRAPTAGIFDQVECPFLLFVLTKVSEKCD